MSATDAAPLVSVIVPVFNTASYLEACLDSLASQTITNIEVIVVDDCSTDDSRKLFDAYRGNPHFHFFLHEVNSGLAATRNTGMKQARGLFIAFVDSDDWISADHFERLLSADTNNTADIICGGFTKVSHQGEELYRQPFPAGHDSTVPGRTLINSLVDPSRMELLWYAWRNLYRRDLLNRAGIQFDPSIRLGEDSLFNLLCFQSAGSIVVSDDCGYFYRSNPDSLTGSRAKPYLLEALSEQHRRKQDILHEGAYPFKVLQALDDYLVEHQLPMLIQNAVRLATDERPASAQVGDVLDNPTIKASIKSSQWVRKGRGRGQQAIVMLAKTGQKRLLMKLLGN